MKFRNIKTNECPICKDSMIVSESYDVDTNGKVMQHANGGFWENRTFSCGQKVSFIPNYSKDIVSTGYVCKNDPERLEIKRKRTEHLQFILEGIRKSKALSDENFTSRLIRLLENEKNHI